MIEFPIAAKEHIELRDLNLQYKDNQPLKEFMDQNQAVFEQVLAHDAEHIFQRIEVYNLIDREYLMNTARKLIGSLVDGTQHQMIILAKDHGRHWAKSDVPLILKMEWLHTFQKTYADFLYNYYKHSNQDMVSMIKLERETTYMLNTFVNHYISSFTEYNGEVLRSHRELIEELSVPIILLAPSIGVLPIFGTIDTYRAKKIQELVLKQIEALKIKKLIVDLSGVAYMDTAVVGHLFRIIEGLALLGCRAIVTGIRAEIANTIIDLGINLTEKIEIQGTLQQALELLGLKVTTIDEK